MGNAIARLTPVLLVLLAFGPGVTILSQTRDDATRSSVGASPQGRLAEAVKAYLTREMAIRKIPGLAFCIVSDGEVTLKGAYGVANLETETPVSVDSVFELSSLTKPITATAVMLLVQDGKVALADPITKYLEGAPGGWDGIRVSHLLSHAAGFPEEVVVGFQGSLLMDIRTAQQFAAIANAPVRFPPGDDSAYSDPGYFLLGMIIEKASGMRYRDFLQKRVFDVLKMTRSSVLDQRRIIKGRVAPYSIRQGALLRGRRDWQHELPSHFGVWSTVEDLARFDAGLTTGALLTRASLQAMWSPSRLADGRDTIVLGRQYGFGWLLADHRGRRTVEHGGFSGTHMLRLPDDRLTVIVLANLDAASGSRPDRLARAIAGLLKPTLRPPEMLTPAPDPAPQTTRNILEVVQNVAAGRPSEWMTPGYRAHLDGMPAPARQRTTAPLGAVRSLDYIRSDDIRWDLKRVGGSVHRTSYYLAQGEGCSAYLTVWLAQGDRVADMSVTPCEPPDSQRSDARKN